MKFYQACFGKPNNVNWSLYNVSEDIPAQMSSFYEKAENRNTPQNLNEKDMFDSNGNPICITEVLSHRGIVAISKIQYGSVDNFGRAAMKAQGFLFSAEDGVLVDPNNILAISESNFKLNNLEEETAPPELAYNPFFTFKDAMEKCGLASNELIKLISCIYISLRSETDYPIYICSPHSDEIMIPLMYCVYRLLPYSLRYNISFSNANNLGKAQFKSLMFVRERVEGMYYFDLESGETNLDLSEIEEHKDDYPFLKILLNQGLKGFNDYCVMLQEELNKMDLSQSTEYDLLKVADAFAKEESFVESMSDQELLRFLLEITALAPLHSNYVDAKLAKYLADFFERNLASNEALMRRVQVRAEKTPCSEFSMIYKQLQMKCLAERGDSAVIDFLFEQEKVDRDRFYDWRQYILNLDDGARIIEKYYINLVNYVKDYTELIYIYNECPEDSRGELLLDALDERCTSVLRKELAEKDDIQDAFATTLRKCEAVFLTLHYEKNEMFYEMVESECLRYWENFDLSKFEFSDVKIANFRVIGVEESPMYQFVSELIGIYEIFENASICDDNFDEISERVLPFLENESYSSPQRLEVVAPAIQTYLVQKLDAYSGGCFGFWYRLAKIIPDQNPYRKLFDWNLSVFIDSARFIQSIKLDFVTKDSVDELISELEGREGKRAYLSATDFDKNSDEYKVLKKRLYILDEISKEMEKRSRAEAKAEEKQRIKALKEEKNREEIAKKEKQKELDSPQKQTVHNEEKRKPEKENKHSGFSIFRKRKDK